MTLISFWGNLFFNWKEIFVKNFLTLMDYKCKL